MRSQRLTNSTRHFPCRNTLSTRILTTRTHGKTEAKWKRSWAMTTRPGTARTTQGSRTLRTKKHLPVWCAWRGRASPGATRAATPAVSRASVRPTKCVAMLARTWIQRQTTARPTRCAASKSQRSNPPISARFLPSDNAVPNPQKISVDIKWEKGNPQDLLGKATNRHHGSVCGMIPRTNVV